ncbi:hypothetical protein AKJ50_00650 [candidate division MSBL1 archaeon SCGC-AAA382A13]|uniref:CoA-disulfide reductase n=1 Tax=candidate division MSBL1 archaeon SCGC-AAA382A13 TaxID=1698279 RepID=A0A133VGJ3_9EURY|nr:hypothetical protein AKJ50_00650 [candidate division MSBL1 archaeon SCGC-AAA382A13]
MSNEKLVVIGGDAAGMSAASKVKREKPEMEVTVFEKQDYVSFGLCGIPYYVSEMVDEIDDLIAITPEKFREKRNIDVKTNHEVVEINSEENKVIVRDEEEKKFEKSYDKLLIATGAHARVSKLKNINLDNIFTLHWLDDGKKVKNFIESENPEKVVVTAGYIGLEMAEAFKRLGLDVTVVAKHEHFLPKIDSEMVEPLEKELGENNVNLRKNSTIVGFEGNEDGEVQKVIFEDGEMETDFVLLSIGVQPTSRLAEDAGIKTGKSGAIVVDDKMRTNIGNIYAAGDCVETNHLITGEKVYIPLGDTANRQGRVAGINIAGGDSTFPGVLGTAITKVFDLGVARTGLSESEAEEAGYNYITSTIRQNSRAFYYPGGEKIFLKMVVEENSGRVLGAQIAGREGVSQRIDVLASLIYNETPIVEIQNLDLAYAPPYSPAWDPIQTCAKVALSKLGK